MRVASRICVMRELASEVLLLPFRRREDKKRRRETIEADDMLQVRSETGATDQ